MKRLYIAAALLLVVVAVTYIKTARGTSQRRGAFEQGRDQADQQLAVFQQDVDSLKELLRLQQESFDDSLARRDGSYREEISRLVSYLDSAIARPQPEPKTQSKRPPAKKPKSQPAPQEIIEQAVVEEPVATPSEVEPPEPEKAKTEPAEATKKSEAVTFDADLRENVLTFYGKLYDDLPKDLTSQERKVALYEISIKTAAEYSITMPQLKAICENYYLSY